MKTIVLICAFLSIFCLNSCSDQSAKKYQEYNMNKEFKNSEKLKKLRHFVLIKFKGTALVSDIARVEQAFAELPSKIEHIKEFEWGINNSPENLNNGFTHGFLLTFDSEEGRDKYLPHPDHKAFGEVLSPLIEDVLVLDYWTN